MAAGWVAVIGSAPRGVAGEGGGNAASAPSSDPPGGVPLRSPLPRPPWSVPVGGTGIGVIDDVVVAPVVYAARYGRSAFLGTAQAIRDLLFPAFRADRIAAAAAARAAAATATTEEEGEETAAAGIQLSPPAASPLDDFLVGEGGEDYARRTAVRDALLARLDAAGISGLNDTHPDALRYGVAVVVGVVLMAVVLTAQAVAAVCARATLRAIFAVTGNEAWLDEADLSAKWQAEAAAAAAAAAAAPKPAGTGAAPAGNKLKAA